VQAVNGLREFLQVERKRIPGGILFEADRLECQLFAGYDPSFDGDEPSGLSVVFAPNGSGPRRLINPCRLATMRPCRIPKARVVVKVIQSQMQHAHPRTRDGSSRTAPLLTVNIWLQVRRPDVADHRQPSRVRLIGHLERGRSAQLQQPLVT